jgi:hypothetical protein|nr:MAG TPA: Protein of unknown function (DUF2089) [Caudoviricetes sp.]
MKAILSKELKHRIECASKNGSVIATKIINELKFHKDVREIISGKGNYFNSLRVVSREDSCTKLKINISYCNKDLDSDLFPDKGNPEAPFFPENRNVIGAGSFALSFKSLNNTSDEDVDYFSQAMCVNSKIKISIYDKMSDFERAYLGENYYQYGQFGNDSSLHKSCMRYDDKAVAAADFYRNFAGCRILIAETSDNQILGRAIIWDNVIFELNGEGAKLSLIDRVYSCFPFINKMILNYAYKEGIQMKKARNTYDSQNQFTVLADEVNISGTSMSEGYEVYLKAKTYVPKIRWHKSGAPYLDTFSVLTSEDGNRLVLTNDENCLKIARFRSTDGTAELIRYVCPVCGKINSNNEYYCSLDCKEKISSVQTLFGHAFVSGVKKYKGKYYPAIFFEKGKPTEAFLNWFNIRKLF